MMKIGILQAGIAPEELTYKHNDYNDMFISLLGLKKQIFSFKTFKVCYGNFPQDYSECDGWIVTGSKYSAYQKLLWIELLEQLVIKITDHKMPILGVCFGHQMIAKALGGRVEKSNKGWGLGLDYYQFNNKAGYMSVLNDKAIFNVIHQDQVVSLPRPATLYASSAFCKYAGFYIGNRVLTIQAHPEFSATFNKDILRLRSALIIPKNLVDKAITEIELGADKVDTNDFASVVSNFFLLHQS